MTSTHRSPSHPSAPREPEIVRASGVHDLLASVPTLIGIRPEESLVVVPFLGSRAGGGFRIPLPQGPNRAEVAVLARGCAGVMETMPRATAALVVVYTRATYAEARGVPQLELGRAVLRTLERTELGIVAVACVAGDGWGRYTDAAECRQPRPLVEIEGSEAGLFARALAEEPLDLARLAEPPLVDDADRAIVEEVLRRSAHSMPDVVPLVERWLTGSSTPRREAMVVRILQSAPLRDQTTLQIARGAATAEAQRGRRRRLDETSAATGERVSEIAEREFLAGARDAHDVEATALLSDG
ncbi:DUF4192 family protein, partial [Rathayibacter tanaceti]|uniref:DUF4192 family protein n=1 Tax=Rathayibacter tanaceti TaxID=1671680 RepID=UPI001F3FECDF